MLLLSGLGAPPAERSRSLPPDVAGSQQVTPGAERAPVAGADEVIGDGGEGGDAIRLLLLAAVEDPAPGFVGAAANMRRGPDPTAVGQAEVADREGGLRGVAVGAVAVKHQRRRAIEGY